MTIREQLERARTREFVTVAQLALLTQYNPQTIYRKAQRGEIPGIVRWGRRIRFVRVVALGWSHDALLARDIRPSA